MKISQRRYDVDWVRVIAIGLLLVYHTAIGFQPWGVMIGFITNKESWQALWLPMMMLNVWRIPLLFFVSGMGAFFALQNRSCVSLLTERTRRILIPYIFGMLAIAPLHVMIWQSYLNLEINWIPNAGHLWFLANIFLYILIMFPLMGFLKRAPESKTARILKRIFGSLGGVAIAMILMSAEAFIVKPVPYELYAGTLHGFILGLVGFFCGFCFAFSGEGFWNMVSKWKALFLVMAAGLFAFRLYLGTAAPGFMTAIESTSWIVTIIGFAATYLNRPSARLSYLSEAAYPVYIIHMLMLYGASAILFPLSIPVELKFFLTLTLTVAGSMLFFEFVVKRISVLRFLFGLKANSPHREKASLTSA